jgi:hypothetical protein
MTNWEVFLKEQGVNLFLSDIAAFEIPKKDFQWLKKEIVKAKKQGVKHNKSLVGHIKEEYSMPGVSRSFHDFLMNNAVNHPTFEKFNNKFSVLSENKPLYLDSFWVNYMKKHEFNPIHDHKGLFSFVVFVKIPYDLKKEEGYFKDMKKNETNPVQTSKFNFVNVNPNGKIITTTVPVDKSFEGKMFMFPATQSHLVNPFYTSDDYRITVSGNIKVKV